MIDIDNKTNLTIDIEFLEEIKNSLTPLDVELIVTDNEEIQTINKNFRNIDAATDVLSFPYEKMPHAPLGSIVISKDFVEQKSTQYGHSANDEFILLFIHGLLHVMGYDHETDNGEMRTKEEEVITKFNLPKSLIVRTQG